MDILEVRTIRLLFNRTSDMEGQEEIDMKIKQILSQHRRDFRAIYECEHCGHEYESSGYDDANFHNNAVPKFKCPECEKSAGDDYQPRNTKRPEGMQI